MPQKIGRYTVLGPLGQGAMGIVYRARDEALERDVALKVMSSAVGDADGRVRFLREARAAARLQHPNIITIYELGEHEGAPFMALELLEGADLQRAIAAGIRPDPKMTLPVVLQILAGLGHAHEQGIVHRDVKPSNLFLCKGRPAKIMDFGVARLGQGTTTAGGVVGTPYYMSPEQVAGGAIDGRSDLFSAGLILYELVTGEKAFRADSVVTLLYKIAHETPDVSLIPKDVPWEGIREVLTRALARNAEDRYANAAAMATEVRAALAALGGSADAPSAGDSGLLIPRSLSTAPRALEKPDPQALRSAAGVRGPGRALAAAGLAIAALGAGLLFWRRGSKAVPPPPPTTLAPLPSTALPAPPSAPPPNRGQPSPSSRKPPTLQAPPPAPPQGVPENPVPVESPVGSLKRAREFLDRGELPRALSEARAVLDSHPNDAEAKTIAEKVEAALVVGQRIRNAREALRRGDKDLALEEIRLGFAVSPKDQRLLDLFREATQ